MKARVKRPGNGLLLFALVALSVGMFAGSGGRALADPVSVTVVPSATHVAAGGLVWYTATVTGSGAGSDSVTASWDPGLAYVRYSSNPVADNGETDSTAPLTWAYLPDSATPTTFTFELGAPTTPGSYSVQVTATGGNATVSGSASVSVDASVAGTAVIPVAADTFVNSAEPDQNFGTASYLESYGGTSTGCCMGGQSYGLLKFNLSAIPAGATITSAEVRLVSSNGFSYNGDDSQHLILLQDNSWTQAGATYNNPPTGFVNISGADPRSSSLELGHDFVFYDGNAEPQLHTFPGADPSSGGETFATHLTDAVQSAAGGAISMEIYNHSNPPVNVGYWVQFYSNAAGNNPDFAPQLVVTYTGGTPVSPTQTGPIFTVNDPSDAADAACTVAKCTLRDAIAAANGHANGATPDTIKFALPGAGVVTLSPATALTAITDPVTIDGTTQPGYAGTPLVQLDGTSCTGCNGLTVSSGGVTVTGLGVSHFAGKGIIVTTGTGSTIGPANVISGNTGAGIEVDTEPNAITANSISQNGGNGIVASLTAPTPPVLVSASLTAGVTTILGTLGGTAGHTFSVDLFDSPSCDPSGTGEGKTFLGTATGSLDTNGQASIDVTASGPALNDAITATYTSDTGATSTFSTCAIVGTGGANNTSWTQASSISLNGNGDGSDSSASLDTTGQARWFKFTVSPGGNAQINLTGLPANYDLAVFSDIGQTYNSLTSTADLQTVSAEFGNDAFSPSVFSPSVFSPSVFSPSVFSPSVFSPSVFSPSVFSPSVFSPSVFSPSVFSPSVFSPSVFSPSVFSPSVFSPDPASYQGAQIRSLIAISANDGTAAEQVNADIWNNTGSFYVRVNGRDGTYDPGAKFTVSVHENTGTCGGVTPSTAADTTSSVPSSSVKTLILTDYPRMTNDGDLSAMEAKVNLFAARTEVAGAVVDLESSPQVVANNATADAHLDCAYAKNLVAGSIRDIVTSYRKLDPGLKYIVVVGNDHVIPFFRYPDTAGIGPESSYVPPVLDTSASQASLQTDDVLSQDAYGATTVLHLKGIDVPVPDLPVGRLVETPTEIAGLLDAYMGLSGGTVATPTSSLVTGYDFMASGAQSVESDFSQGLAATATNDQLITNDGVSPTNTGSPPLKSWTADQLRTDLLGSRHDLIFLAGHFSANNTLAADYSSTMNSTELAASNVNLKNSIVFSAGCHSGYNLVNSDAVPGVSQPLDWTEAFAQKGATLIAGTGYQYGDTNFLAYSEQLYADFAHALRYGTGPVAVGSALMEAKQTYLNSTTSLQGIDIKSLLESTLYGLPMLSVNMPNRLPSPTGTPVGGSPQAVSANPGGALGLSDNDVTLTPAVTPGSLQLTDPTGSTLGQPIATWLNGPDGIDTSPGAPTLPVASYDATSGGVVLRGVGFRGGTYTDTSGVTPLTGAPATELGNPHSAFISNAFYPAKLWTVNYFSGLAGATSGATVKLTPAQYKSDAPGSLTDILRQFSSVSLRLFYSGNIANYGANTPGLAAPPTISRVDATGTNTSVTFQVHAVGDPSAGMQQVWVTYAGIDAGRWESFDLTQDPIDSTLWSGTLTLPGGAQLSAMRFIVQAANGVGLVSLDDNQGAYYTPNQIPAALQLSTAQSSGIPVTATTLHLVTPPSSVNYGTAPVVSAKLTGPGGVAIAQQQVTFTAGASSLTGVTDATGVASVKLPLLDQPGAAYTLTAAFAGTASLAASADSVSPFAINQLSTVLTLHSGGSPVLDTADTGISAQLTSGGIGLGQHSVAFVLTPTGGGPAVTQVRITDLNGNASLGVVPQALSGGYNVKAYFGSASGAPIALPNDAVYLSSSTGTTPLTVTPPTVLSINRVGATPTVSASVAWTVTFNEAVTGVSASNFSLVSTLAGVSITTVTGSGAVYTVTAGTGTGSGTLGLSLNKVTGITDAVGGIVSVFAGQLYTVDRAAPTATFTFPLAGAILKATSYAAGCPTVGFCGTVSDPSGVQSVQLSIQNSAGKYWNGTSFSATAQTFVTATLSASGAAATSTTWRYPLVRPADGGYTIDLKTTDSLGNGQAAATYAAVSTFTLDTVAPTITFTGGKSYGILDTVAVACTATDPAPSSQLVSNPCTGFSVGGLGSSFTPGAHTVPSPAFVATDKAGNSSAASSTTFTITVTTADLCKLTTQYSQSSAKYAALNGVQKAVVNVLSQILCNSLSAIVPKLTPAAKAQLITAYKSGVQSLVTQGWLTATQAATLTGLTAGL